MPIEIACLLASCVFFSSNIVDPDALARGIFLQDYFWREPVLIVFAIMDRPWQSLKTGKRFNSALCRLILAFKNKQTNPFIFLVCVSLKKGIQWAIKEASSVSCRHYQPSYEASSNYNYSQKIQPKIPINNGRSRQ